MARVDKLTGVQEQMTAMRGEVLDTVRVHTRAARRKRIMWLVTLILVVCGALAAAVVVARTGLVRIPGISALVYQEPVPERVVVSGAPIESIASTALTNALVTGATSVSVSLPEASLTQSFRTILSNAQVTWVDAARAQVLVHEEGMDVWLPLSGTESVMMARLVPHVKNGQLSITLSSVSVGAVGLPSSVIDAVVRPALEASLADFNAAYAQYAQIDSVETHEGILLLVGTRVGS